MSLYGKFTCVPIGFVIERSCIFQSDHLFAEMQSDSRTSEPFATSSVNGHVTSPISNPEQHVRNEAMVGQYTNHGHWSE